MPESLRGLLKAHLLEQNPAGLEPFYSVTWDGIKFLAQEKNLSLARAMELCLEEDLWPERLRPNRGTLSVQEQIRLLRSTVAVVGAGGLGGMAILLLARVGIGGLHICDGDVFEESNLNRQFLSSLESLGRSKAKWAAQEVARINPAVQTKVFPHWADSDNLPEILEGTQAAVDCLDNLKARYDLERASRKMGLAYVHGAVAGLEGLVMTIRPGDPGLAGLYGPDPTPKDQSAETVMGVPTMIPAAVATLQVNEVVKLLLGRPTLERGHMLHLDLNDPSLEIMKLA